MTNLIGFDAAGKFSGFFPGFEPTPATTADNDDLSMRELLEFGLDPERQAKLLELKNKFEAERMAQAAPYNLMYQLPKTIMQGAMLPATIALGGSNRVADLLGRMGGIQTGGASPNAGSRYFGSFG